MQDPEPAPALPAPGPREFVHRLNNLLTVVLATAESALATNDPAEMRRALETIAGTSLAMAQAARAYAKAGGPHTGTEAR